MLSVYSDRAEHTITSAQIDNARAEIMDHRCWARSHRERKPCYGNHLSRHLNHVVRDIALLNYNVLSWDTFKIAVTLFPAVIAARMFDQRVQNCFFDAKHQKNVCQLPKACHDIAKFSIGLPILFLGSFVVFGQDPEVRETAWLYLLGMPFVIFMKDLAKKLDFDVCLRPYHEKFAPKKRLTGGFPSGHLAEATYTAVLWGMRYGPKAAIPLGFLAALVGGVFINCNRHYTSQLLAGAGFGAIYAVAANKVIDRNLSRDWRLYMQSNGVHGTGFGVHTSF